MNRITLQRTETGDEGTFGKIEIEGHAPWISGELPWRDNAQLISCIPAGVYPVHMALSQRFARDLYHLENVPGRTAVLIHPANYVGDRSKDLESELNGCIALGERIAPMRGQKALQSSRIAVARFEDAMNREPFELEIIDVRT